MTLKKIGFVGLGVMGRSMVSNLMKAGFSPVVNNRTKKSADAHRRERGARPPTAPPKTATQISAGRGSPVTGK